jgi:hypothetical protein
VARSCAGRLGALVALLTDDVFISMPPMPFGYEGLDVVGRFCAGLFGAGRRFDLVPTRANGQPAFGAYLRAPAGIRNGTGLYVLTLANARIGAMTRFDNSVLPWSGLPRSLPARDLSRPLRKPGRTQPPGAEVDSAGKIAECDRKLAQYRAALDAGASPATVAAWIAETEAETASYALRSPKRRPRMTQQEIKFIVTSSQTWPEY